MTELIAAAAKLPIFVCALWVLSFISVFLHEFGHALGYMLATGDRDWHIAVGHGKKLLDTKVLTVKLIVLDGFFAPSEDKIASKKQLLITFAGGPAVSLMLVIGLLVLKFGGISLPSGVMPPGWTGALLYIALFINFFILLWSVIPARCLFGEIEGLETDGMQIINALRRHEE